MRNLYVILMVGFLLSCNIGDKYDGDITNPYSYGGTVEVTSTDLAGNESFGATIFGNSEGTYIPSDSKIMNSKALAGNSIISIPEILQRYKEKTFIEKKSYSFSSFKLVTDIFLKPDIYFTGYANASTSIMRWNGDPDDVSQYIDLVSGEFNSTTEPNGLFQYDYKSVLLQINAPAETIIPDFGNDVYDKTDFSWTDIKPFWSTNSSAQHIIYSTYVKEPFVKWLGVKSDNFDSLATVQEYYQRQFDAGDPSPHTLTDFEDWAFNAPLNQEFFDQIKGLNITEDPNSGEAWLFMPMNQSLDLTSSSKVTFSFELYMKHLFEVFTDNYGDNFYMLGAAKNFKNHAGELFFGPLPVRISYKENPNGFTVDPVP